MDSEAHQRKFENSERLVNEAIMDLETTPHCDWLTIIMYYGVYHLVHKQCANRKNPVHPDSHSKTLAEARQVKAGHQVYPALLTLEQGCFKARYEAKFFNTEDLVKFKEKYDIIKNILG